MAHHLVGQITRRLSLRDELRLKLLILGFGPFLREHGLGRGRSGDQQDCHGDQRLAGVV